MTLVLPAVGNAPIKRETEALEYWANREANPLLRALRQEATTARTDIDQLEVDVAAVTAAGPAGGDLAGTYPNPSVAAITTTSGPLSLAVGAVADGAFLKRSGATLVGDNPPSVSIRGYRSKDQGGAFVNAQTRVHIAGYANTGGLFASTGVQNLQGMGAGQMSYAIPEYFEKAGTINRLVTRTNGLTGGAAASPRVRMGVYADGTLAAGNYAGSPFPGARMGQSAIIDTFAGSVNNLILETVGLSIAVEAGTYVWFTIVFNNDAVTKQHAIPALGYLYPILGWTFDATTPTTIATDAATGGVGWRHALTFGTTEDFPDPYPQTSPVIMTDTTTIPVIGYGFQQS